MRRLRFGRLHAPDSPLAHHPGVHSNYHSRLPVTIEAYFQGRLTDLIASVTIGLAIVSAVIILYEFFWPIAIIAVLIAGFYILFENLCNLWA